MMKVDIDIAVEQYMTLPYRMEVYFDDDYWAAEFPELSGLVAGHETWEGLLGAVEDAKRSYFTAAIEQGATLPQPIAEQDQYSGRIMLRLQKSLHGLAAKRARHEGVSLNTLIAGAVAKEIGWGVSAAPFSELGILVQSRLDHRHSGVLAYDHLGSVPWLLRSERPTPKWRSSVPAVTEGSA